MLDIGASVVKLKLRLKKEKFQLRIHLKSTFYRAGGCRTCDYIALLGLLTVLDTMPDQKLITFSKLRYQSLIH
jgi:hypothetical protein